MSSIEEKYLEFRNENLRIKSILALGIQEQLKRIVEEDVNKAVNDLKTYTQEQILSKVTCRRSECCDDLIVGISLKLSLPTIINTMVDNSSKRETNGFGSSGV